MSILLVYFPSRLPRLENLGCNSNGWHPARKTNISTIAGLLVIYIFFGKPSLRSERSTGSGNAKNRPSRAETRAMRPLARQGTYCKSHLLPFF
jgi:hypothetical protein